jgi:hypothetical protein
VEEVQVPDAVQDGSSARREAQVLLASLAWGTALIHVLAAAHHYREWALYGVFFTILAPAQAIWGGLVFQRSEDRRILLVGAIANLLVAVVWAMSRTTGIPIGPTPWQPEVVGWHDVIATLNELAMAGLAAGLAGVLPWRVSDAQLARAARWTAVPLLVVTVLAASFAHEHN